MVALARSAIGLMFLLLLRAVRHEPIKRAAVRKNLVKLLILGAMLGFNWIFLFEAYNHTSVAAATMCYYMAPVFIILLSPVVFGEKITRHKGLCALAAVFGMVLVSDVFSSGLHGARGLAYGLIAASLYAAIVIVNRTLRDISAEDRTILQFAHTGLAYVLYFGSIADVSAQTAALLSYIDPVVAVLLSLTLLHESMSPAAIFGAALVIGAMALSERKPDA